MAVFILTLSPSRLSCQCTSFYCAPADSFFCQPWARGNQTPLLVIEVRMDLNPQQTVAGFYSNPQQSQLRRVCNNIPMAMPITLVATMSLLPFACQLFVELTFILLCITSTRPVMDFATWWRFRWKTVGIEKPYWITNWITVWRGLSPTTSAGFILFHIPTHGHLLADKRFLYTKVLIHFTHRMTLKQENNPRIPLRLTQVKMQIQTSQHTKILLCKHTRTLIFNDLSWVKSKRQILNFLLYNLCQAALNSRSL